VIALIINRFSVGQVRAVKTSATKRDVGRSFTRMNFTGELLFKARNQRNLSQVQFAELLGITYRKYYRVESGYENFPTDLIDLTASILRLERQDIIDAIYADQKAKANKYILTRHGDS
jgi:DNA-binding XRE family transcriptional regulator